MSQEVGSDAEPPPPSVRRFGRWVYAVTIVRDATVTSWLHVATSPIDGKLEFKQHEVDGIVGSDGIIVRVKNDRLSHKDFDVPPEVWTILG